jgi:hypothetical protein
MARVLRAIRLLVAFLILALSLTWLVTLADPVLAAPPPSWGLRSIDTMAESKDQMHNQVPASSIQEELQTDKSAGANTVAIEVPYDAASSYAPPVTPGYEATWVNTAHSLGLHVWFRSHWNTWEGDYGFPKETPTTVPERALGTAAAVLDGQDTTSYLALTYHWILDNPDYFRDGDIFTPASEPENAGIEPYCTDPCMFSSDAVFNQWLQDSMTVDRAAFASLGLAVQVGYWGISGWNATHGVVSQATVNEMGVFDVDDYFQSPVALVANLSQIEATYQVPLVLGEWGDIWDGGNQALMVPEINSIMAAVSELNYVVGFNYFRDIGYSQGEGILDPTTMQLNSAGLAVSHWFRAMDAATWGGPPETVGAGTLISATALTASPATLQGVASRELRQWPTSLTTPPNRYTRSLLTLGQSSTLLEMEVCAAAFLGVLILLDRRRFWTVVRYWGAAPSIR